GPPGRGRPRRRPPARRARAGAGDRGGLGRVPAPVHGPARPAGRRHRPGAGRRSEPPGRDRAPAGGPPRRGLAVPRPPRRGGPAARGERAPGSVGAEPAPTRRAEETPPLDLGGPGEAVDLARILDAAANRAREGLRVVEDYVRFVLDDPGLTRRLKDVRHRLAEAERGLEVDLLIGARDAPEDVGTHIMTPTEQFRENPRAVLAANFKRIAEAMRSLEEY